MKKRLIFLGVMAFAFLICIVPHVVLGLEINLLKAPLCSISNVFYILFKIIHAIIAYVKRHEDNYCTMMAAAGEGRAVRREFLDSISYKHSKYEEHPTRKFIKDYISYTPPKKEDNPHTHTKKYKIEFFCYFTLLCITIPLYIPFLLYTSKMSVMTAFLPILFWLLTDIVYMIHSLICLPQTIKYYKAKQQKARDELREQQRKEEMGRFK